MIIQVTLENILNSLNFLSVLSVQDIKTLLDVDKQKVMPLYPSEILNYLKEKEENQLSDLKRTFEFLIIDCRIKKNLSLPNSLIISKSILENPDVFLFLNNIFIKICLIIISFLRKN